MSHFRFLIPPSLLAVVFEFRRKNIIFGLAQASKLLYTTIMGQLTKSNLSTLLRDEDPAIVTLMRQQLYELGTNDIESLEKLLHCDDAVVSRHIQEVLDEVLIEQNEQDFLLYCHSFSEDGDMEEAAWRLAAVCYPRVNYEAGKRTLDEWAEKLRLRLTNPDNAIKGINDIAAFVTYELGFHPNDSTYYDTENSFINRVIETRTGIPITLSLIYLFLGKRLDLPIHGIGLPGRFICAWDNVLFDPFNKGQILSKDDCIRMLEDMGISFQEGFLSVTPSKAILMRMIHNLVNIYASENNTDMQQKMINFIVALQT
ncbi:MAG: transglutaminase-like domain-containing protein [Verrucomicrobiota bacterium]|nr:transglutaminase-like domain-containing protein [Verrucomicrobiota bacterium]